MASTNKTQNLKLPQWKLTDKPEMQDFNEAFENIETEVAKKSDKSYVDVELSKANNKISNQANIYGDQNIHYNSSAIGIEAGKKVEIYRHKVDKYAYSALFKVYTRAYVELATTIYLLTARAGGMPNGLTQVFSDYNGIKQVEITVSAENVLNANNYDIVLYAFSHHNGYATVTTFSDKSLG